MTFVFQNQNMISKKFFYLFVLFLSALASFSQDTGSSEAAKQKFTLSGTITDAKSNETLIGVNISIPELKTGVTTNEYGFYSITLPKGNYTIQITYLGFQNVEEKIQLVQNTKKNFKLGNSEQQLDEIVVTSNKKSANIKAPEMSVNKLSIATIKKMPVVLGEADVLKSILLLPGVTNAGEGQSGFNVRGGGADQNLVLLDEATIFNSSHVFGFFSVFNPDAIKDLKLYKGGIPAHYGGRASSVLDIYQKEGNSNTFHMNGGIGLISSRLLAEGPIVKDKGSFLVGGRTSYAHLFLMLTDNENSASFYDLNAKLNYKLNDNNSLYVSGYFGRDFFNISEEFENTYGNSTFNLRWNHLFSEKHFSNLSAIFSDYYYGLTLSSIGFDWQSSIKNFNFKYNLKYYLNDKIKLTYGLNTIYYKFNPGTIKPIDSNSIINYNQLDKKNAFEPSLYVEAEHQASQKLSFMYGLRFSMFYRLGPSKVNLYENNQAVTYNDQLKIYEKGVPIGSVSYGYNDVVTSFSNLEPRFSGSYLLNEESSIKASYNRMVQYLQLVSNTASPTPLDIWTPSDQYIKPQIADQVAVGYFRNFKDDMYSLEVESFYKEVKNRIDYIDGADLIANNAIEQVVLNGQLRAYGLELMLRKNTGKMNGWIAYTLSNSEQQTPGRTPNESGINNGNWYKSGYHKLHNLAITTTYNLNPKWTFGGNFIIQSGQPVTFPNGQYEYQGINVPSYDARNANNLPLYHHLDLSATYVPKPEKRKGWQSEWVFSVYNIYNRKNAASISFRENQTSGSNEAVKLSIFGAVPSVSYNFKF
ncbi:Outer membrane receptor proteins, mostly Fe transport [Flavobacterium fluvii]|uniref:Outer membrane receptor proteins, mostly Fe transport n=2 Tax=Flavobacterium fluvii TaxID=468056 RepID=A0A1M5NHX8_9FLAO|nr:Outer membrane receptor proteins, mostly Fe transport [Flavobacterium fluvii]